MKSTFWDVVVIGGGAAGVAAAKSLTCNYKTILLEKEERLGGRVHSPIIGNHRCELGATIGYNSSKLPLDVVETEFVIETGEMALQINGQLVQGRTPKDCLAKAAVLFDLPDPSALPLQSMAALFNAGNGASALDANDLFLRRALQGFFNVMNPGNVFAYDSLLWDQAMHRFHPSHHIGGNIEFIDHLAQDLNIGLNRGVEEITQEDGFFRICGDDFELSSRSLIIATDAANASGLLRNIDQSMADATAAVDYGSFVTLASEICGKIPDKALSYLVDADMDTAICAQLHTPDPERTHRLTLFSGAFGMRMLNASDHEIVNAANRVWENFPEPVTGKIIGRQISRWPRAGTIITPQFGSTMAKLKDYSARQGRIAVAGDYVSQPFYGIQAAVASGVAAASRIMRQHGGH